MGRLTIKRFKKNKNLIKVAIKNTSLPLTEDEKICKNILLLNGIKHPSAELIRQSMKNIGGIDRKE